MTTFVTWQLRVTLDSIRNSCDVFVSLNMINDGKRMMKISHWVIPSCQFFGEPVMDNVSARRGARIRRWCYRHLMSDAAKRMKLEYRF